ncbi:hypothetical protein EMIHUDRAFT_246943 [Emiliania huxleyi CCMP1516]|uniref:SAP domain-containing protein n=4 Tax=Emiliania huxleyi TaxID=2903 RepID=A0A0D3IQ13_EMIH1|nr:hypothetical protein EMIHUDRAFT_246943 [Emiliania huxleyi CCMP1516]EOD13348.1 hypothetical protein EMIHUDRAFT_246943 [Emiliania huxleyi CCMP1516]|eukprot:XP_005765777.1 hypothetical protein EMIHUDRAFT_246943 [Emiliania huxleyi CCMP1516]
MRARLFFFPSSAAIMGGCCSSQVDGDAGDRSESHLLEDPPRQPSPDSTALRDLPPSPTVLERLPPRSPGRMDDAEKQTSPPQDGREAGTLKPKYMTLGQLKRALRQRGEQPAEGASKEALQAQLSALLGLDPSGFSAAAAEADRAAVQKKEAFEARRAAAEQALQAQAATRKRTEGSLELAGIRVATGGGEVAGGESAQEGELCAVTMSRPKGGASRRPPTRKPPGAAREGGGLNVG